MVQIDPAKDLAAMFNPPQEERYSGMRYGQGTILSWDADTFENTVAFRDFTLTNVPILNGPDALTYQPGTIVSLIGWAPNGGFGAWWILGRVITPGANAASQAIDFLTSNLGAALARSVIGESVFFDTNSVGGIRDAFDVFGDLEFSGDPSVGPTVNFTLDGDKFLAMWGARTRINTLTSAGNDVEGSMSVDVSGPDSFPPSSSLSAASSFVVNNDQRVALDTSPGQSRLFSVPSGSYTIQAKYRVQDFTGELDDLRWDGAWLVVIAF